MTVIVMYFRKRAQNPSCVPSDSFFNISNKKVKCEFSESIVCVNLSLKMNCGFAARKKDGKEEKDVSEAAPF